MIRLQASARRWLAQQEVQRLRRERDRRLAWLEVQERRRREEKEEQLRDRRQRWMNPQQREDFDLLYHALESRSSVDVYITSLMSCRHVTLPPRRCACLCLRVEV